MQDETNDAMNRRNFLAITTAALGAGGIGFSAVPFLKAMSRQRISSRQA